MKRLIFIAALALMVVWLHTVVGYGAAQTTPPATADALRAQLVKERRDHRTTVVRLARENRRLRNHASPFTEADTRQAARLVAVVGGWPETGALRVARCESHHLPHAYNATELGGSNASGSWQVLWPSTWLSTDVGRAFPTHQAAFNPYLNAFAALRVWQRQGRTFREWNDVCAALGDRG